MASPSHGPQPETCYKHRKRHQVAHGPPPEAPEAAAKNAVNLYLNRKAASERSREHAETYAVRSQQERQQRERKRIRDYRARKAKRVDQPDRTSPPELVRHQLREAGLMANVIDHHRRHDHIIAKPAHGNAHGVVVRQASDERFKSADAVKCVSSERNGGTETGFGEPELQAHKHTWQKMLVDGHRRQARP